MYAVTSNPFVSRTRATFRNAEFGFFGVVVYTRVHTPRFCGLPRSAGAFSFFATRSEEHTSELQSHHDLVCRLLLEKKKNKIKHHNDTYIIPSEDGHNNKLEHKSGEARDPGMR